MNFACAQCDGVILADTENWKNPLCCECWIPFSRMDVPTLIEALKFYADPNNYQKGYAPPTEDEKKFGLLTEPLVIQDGGKIAIEALK